MFNTLQILALYVLVANAASSSSSTIKTTFRPTDGSAVVDFSVSRGAPKQYGSGVLYGIPDAKQWQIPVDFFTEIGVNHGRGGGSQVAGKGWIGGEKDYHARIESVVSNYRTIRSLNGKFFLLNAALWGADGLQSASDKMPGDNNDWSDYDAFLVRLAEDIKGYGITEGLIVELWNEGDNQGFWKNRSMEQWLTLWGWGYHRLRALLPENVQISGPAFATELKDGGWWPNYFEYIKKNQSIPDQFTWHCLYQTGGIGNDPAYGLENFEGLRQKYDIPERPVSINEYGIPEDQNPGYSAWVLSTFERHNVYGLRANWASRGALHDYLASLVGKPDDTNGRGVYDSTSGGYWPTGEWQLYKYYNRIQKGVRIRSQRSKDGRFDVFATYNELTGVASIIAGSNNRMGSWTVDVENINSLPHFKETKKARVIIKEYPWIGFRAKVEEKDIKTVSVEEYPILDGGKFSVPVDVKNKKHAYTLDIHPSTT